MDVLSAESVLVGGDGLALVSLGVIQGFLVLFVEVGLVDNFLKFLVDFVLSDI